MKRFLLILFHLFCLLGLLKAEKQVGDFIFSENNIITEYAGDKTKTLITIPERAKGFKGDVFSECKNVKSIIWEAKDCANLVESLEERPVLPKPGEGKVTICVQAPQNLCGYIVAPGTITDWEPGLGDNKALELVDGYSTWYSGIFDWEDSGECRFKIAATDVNGNWNWDYQMDHYEILEGDYTIRASDIYIRSDNQVFYIKISDFEKNPCSSASPFSSIAENITSFTIADGVKQLPDYLCQNMINLKELNIGKDVEAIGISSFENCKNLETVNLPSSIQTIKSEAFFGCENLKKVNFIGSLDEWLNIAFHSYSSNPLYYGKYLYFNNELLSELNIDREGGIFPFAFLNCQNIKKVNIGSGVTEVHNSAFEGCSSLISVYLPNSIISIRTDAFRDCSSLTDITIPNNITSIYDGTFYGCTNLNSVTIPNSVKLIGRGAFTKTGIYNDETKWENGYLYINNHLISAKSNIIKDTCIIKKDTKSVAIGAFDECEDLTSIIWNAKECADFKPSYYSDHPFFYNRSQITSFTIGDEVVHLPAYLCCQMENLKEISIPKSVISIGYGAFGSCIGLTKVNYLGTVDKWAEINFESTHSNPTYYAKDLYINDILLTDVKITTADSIKKYAFINCASLKSVEIGESVNYIAISVFEGTNFYNEESNWQDGVLYGTNCLIKAKEKEVLGDYTIRDGIILIADGAFNINNELTSIVIPNSIVKIGTEAFYNCYWLDTIYNYTDLDIIKGRDSYGYVAYYANKVMTWRDGLVIEDNEVIDYIGNEKLTAITIPWFIESIKPNVLSKCNNITSMKWDAVNCTLLDGKFNSPLGENNVNITSFTFGDKVETIPSYLCYGMTGLKEINIPHSVTSIGDNAFAGCKNLKRVTAYPMLVPEVESEEVFANFNAYLYVPCDVHEDYDLDDVFGNFKYIKCIESEEVDAPDKVEIEVDEDNNATVTWPSTDGANSYELVISKNGEVFCTLIFNANGQLASIDFGSRSASVGFQFIVTGLDGASKYKYQMTAIDKKGNEITSYKGVFATNGYEGSLEDDEEDEPTDVVETLADANITISDGLITCQDTDFTIYNTLGQDVTAYNGSLQPGVYVVSIADDVVKVMMK